MTEESLHQNIIYIVHDVDDTRYHGSTLNTETSDVLAFKCRPPLKKLLGQLDRLRKCFPTELLRLCYEASYIGYTL